MGTAHQLGVGRVLHSRHVPKSHHFSMPVYMLWLALDDAHGAPKLGRLSRFCPSDYFDHSADSGPSLQRAIIEAWQARGLEVNRVSLLTNVRSLNTAMNPLSVFYCYQGEQLRGLIAEVTNTPWGERHHYFLAVGDGEGIDCHASAEAKGDTVRFVFDKNFHVSPFNPMDMRYDMAFSTKPKQLSIRMKLSRHALHVFDARVALKLQPLTQRAWRTWFFKRPWITFHIRCRIYIEALKLWLKGVPLYSHPKHSTMRSEKHSEKHSDKHTQADQNGASKKER